MITLNTDKFPVMTNGSIRLLAMGLAGQCRALIMAGELAQQDNDEPNTVRANEMLEDHDNLVRSVHMLTYGVYGREAGLLFSEIYSAMADEVTIVEPDLMDVKTDKLPPAAPVAAITGTDLVYHMMKEEPKDDR